ncbi:hypothetical protein Pmani_014797 [Petrolisthes manimaculis]|uniref:Uncharacterized protein n=1 Tax=Petrolisthes manimaculis TaxID=1843537 RepID=A0AAE1U7Z7_9EUCA|nr:hypothetical protein Pmani_014797 [Petrolisthes manimaculis]
MRGSCRQQRERLWSVRPSCSPPTTLPHSNTESALLFLALVLAPPFLPTFPVPHHSLPSCIPSGRPLPA